MTDLQPENASMVQTFCIALQYLWDEARGKSGLSTVVVVVVVVNQIERNYQLSKEKDSTMS
jgi:hypothetical protein